MIKKYNQYIKENMDDEFYEFEDEEDDHFDDSFIKSNKFRQFLIDNNCLENYVKNVKDYWEKNHENEDTYIDIGPSEYICGIFDWYSTPEGGFWAELDKKWYDLNKWDYDADYDDEFNYDEEDIDQ